MHNRYVVERLKTLGAVFVDELDAVPDGARVIFSAHGVSQAVRAEASDRGLEVFDATCPLVTLATDTLAGGLSLDFSWPHKHDGKNAG